MFVSLSVSIKLCTFALLEYRTMRIAHITPYTPTYYNFNSPSALPYYIIRHRDSDTQIKIWTFNCNEVPTSQQEKTEQELSVSLIDMGIPDKLRKAFSPLSRLKQIFDRYPYRHNLTVLSDKYIQQIKDYAPDIIWIYNLEQAHFATIFPETPVIVTGPDSYSLCYSRFFRQPGFLSKAGRLLRWRQYLRMEKALPTSPRVHYHLVGEIDRNALLKVNPHVQASFIHHPCYDNLGQEKRIDLSHRKLRVIIPAPNNFYTGNQGALITQTLKSLPSLSKAYSFTFLGKGWEKTVTRLTKLGYEAKSIGYVDSFAATMIQHDIAIIPIAVGSGTKGKTLDTLSNGLLTIGTNIALENIDINDGVSAMRYDTAACLRNILEDILANPAKYEEIASAGQRQALITHDPQKTADRFFNLAKKIILQSKY